MAMTEVQEHWYICKICNKSCVSGKSLGGHMRIHLSQISSSKKAEKLIKCKGKMESEGGRDVESASFRLENSENQSYSTDLGKKVVGFGEDDPNNCYELRENPKKSRRISDNRDDDLKKEISCKECGKEFSSLKALSGHMRSHSIKNTELNHCKTCGKGFQSMRALFGHMKSHSKRSRAADDPGEISSDLENFCPVRRKRSGLRYNKIITPNPSFSSLNGSSSEFGEMEEVAMCLMMLSRRVSNLNKFNFVAESSDNDSGFCGAESLCRSKGIAGKKNDSNKMLKMSETVGELDSCISGSANALSNKNVSRCEDFNHSDSTDPGELGRDMLIANPMKGRAAQVPSKSSSNAPQIDDAMTEADLRVLKSCPSAQETIAAVDRPEIVTSKSSPSKQVTAEIYSLQVLGASGSFMNLFGDGTSVTMDVKTVSTDEAKWNLNGLECSESKTDQGVETMSMSFELARSKDHKCPICFMVFPSGLALAGHKRAHYTESKEQETKATNQELPDAVPDLFDLNFPVPADDSPRVNVGPNPWWIEGSHELKALVIN